MDTIYVPVLSKEREHKHFPTVKTINILFYKLAVCRRGTKRQNTYLIRVGKG